MILKIQRSVSPLGYVLIYNEDRSVMEQIPLTDGLNDWFGDRYKVFAEAEVRNHELFIDDVVSDQGW